MVSQHTEPAINEPPAVGDAKRGEAGHDQASHDQPGSGNAAHDHAGHEKRMAALASVGSGVILVSLKVFLAVVTGSLAFSPKRCIPFSIS